MIYQHPLAYVLGLEGIALMRGFAGLHDREFVLARLAEIRELLDSADELGDGVTSAALDTTDGYRTWSESYDDPGNLLIDLEQPVVWDIVDGLEPGVALDAACGTGRHAEHLDALGHRVIGVDTSPEMLAKARAKLPDAEFHEADLHRLPLPDDHVDLVVCALALVHVPDLTPVLAEFVRVLRPGGHLVISDSRGVFGDLGIPLAMADADGFMGYMPNRIRPVTAYLQAALPLGLQVRRCEEPRRPSPLVDSAGTPLRDAVPIARHEPGDAPNIWALHPWCPDATNAAFGGSPAAIVWLFQLAA